MGRSRISALFALLSLSLFGGLAACGGDARSGDGSEIELLVTAPLTGYSADIGQDICDGAKFSASRINQAGGIKDGPMEGSRLAVQCADNPNLATEVAATTATKYLSDEAIWMNLGFASSGEALAAGKVTARQDLGVLSTGGGADFLTDGSQGNIVTILPNTNAVGAAMVDFCKQYYGAQTYGVLAANYSSAASFLTGVKTAAKETGLQIVVDERYDSSNTSNYASLLTAIKAKDPDCLLLFEYPPTLETIVAQGRQLGLTMPMLDLGAGGTNLAAVKAGGDALKGFIFGSWGPFDPSEMYRTAESQWDQKYKRPFSSYAAYAYDGVLAIEYALIDGASTREELQKYLAKVDGPGLLGQIKFDKSLRVTRRPFQLLEQTGPTVDDLESVGRYYLFPTGTAEFEGAESCKSRDTCQLNLR